MSLGTDIRGYNVPVGAVGIWWLGQEGFVFKSPGGTVVVVDPYLSNSCKPRAEQAGINADRLYPPPILPEDMDVDVYAMTHSHQDHCDSETVLAFRSSGRKAIFVAPGETMEKLEGLGISRDEIRLIWPNKEYQFNDVRLKATFAIPYSGDDLTHIGYLIFISGSPVVYLTGDTDYNDLLGYVAASKPEIMITVINGAYRNLGPNEAAKLTQKLDPKVVIPCHYDLFPDNSINPRVFRTCLVAAGIGAKYKELEHGMPYIFKF